MSCSLLATRGLQDGESGGNAGAGGSGGRGGTGGGTAGMGGMGGAGGCDPALRTDSANCCVMGRDCGEGSCVDGECQPFALATGLDQPFSLAVDDTHVYFYETFTNLIRRVTRNQSGADAAVTGNTFPGLGLALGDATLHFTGEDGLRFANKGVNQIPTVTLLSEGARGVAVTSQGEVYWAADAGIYRDDALWIAAPSNYGDVVATASDQIFFVDVGSEYAVFPQTCLTPGNGAVYRMDVNVRVPVITGLECAAELDATDSRVVATDVEAGTVLLNEAAGAPGGERVIGTGTAPLGVALDDERVFWADHASGEVFEYDIATQTEKLRATGQNTPMLMVEHGDHVYWVNLGDPQAGSGGGPGMPTGSVMSMRK